MPSLFAQFIKEYDDWETKEYDDAFFCYQAKAPELTIRSMFIAEESRSKEMLQIIEADLFKLAQELKCDFITGTVDTTVKNATKSLAFYLRWGMEILMVEGKLIYLIRRVDYGSSSSVGSSERNGVSGGGHGGGGGHHNGDGTAGAQSGEEGRAGEVPEGKELPNGEVSRQPSSIR